MSKMIVFCADGTWNGPGQDDDGDRQPDPTNVYKLFCGLQGDMSVGTLTQADEQEKELRDGNGALLQIAKYIHGVGDSRNPIRRIIGGAFGAGMIARIVRGYTFISRNYEPDDSIVLVGFSRGAYTVRALAGIIASQGLLAKLLTGDRETAYRAGAKAWYRYREQASKKAGFLQGLIEAMTDLPAFVSRDSLKDTDFVEIQSIASVGVWDTVGALGLPNYIQEPGADAFKFTDRRLSPKVKKGFHALALDEQRADFVPTLWDKAENVVQVVFPGAHADVGGGYSMKNRESELSDIALNWMVEQLASVGVKFGSPIFSVFHPSALGVAHQPWCSWPFNDPQRIAPRAFQKDSVQGHPSIDERKGKAVCPGPNLAPAVYSPTNWP